MKPLMFLALPLLLAGSAVQAKPHHAAAMKWMDAAGAGLPSGAQMAVVSGDPGKEGMFKVQLKMPADYAIAPHHHPTDEIVRVRSGTLSYGMGDKVDKANAGQLTDPKTHVTMAAGMNHWVFTTEPTLVEVTGMGPFQIIYANPKDDPRTK
jgi:quercetin dioxygenase-like cupin family protein